MLSCKELVARSSDFLDGQLDFRGQLAVRSHLLMCRIAGASSARCA